MDYYKEAMEFAKNIYPGYETLDYMGDYEGYEVYIPNTKEYAAIGLPISILVNDEGPKKTKGYEETFKIMDQFMDKDPIKTLTLRKSEPINRFKVKRDEKLSKAIDRSKLVLVEVPVQGKTKSYRANRWKNPNQALKLLVKELEKQNIPNIEDIKFKDKTTGKSYDKEELVSEYKKANSNKTLQEFVKERYTIVNPKRSKKAKASTKTTYDGEKPNKENPYNLKNLNGTNKTEDNEQRNSLYNKYQVEKEYIKDNGEGSKETAESDRKRHSILENIFNTETNTDFWNNQKGKVYETNELIDYYKENQDETNQSNKDKPKLKGSERQVSWAEGIREKFIEEVEPSVDEMKKYQRSGTDAQKEIANKYLQAVELITKDDNSVNWIQTYRLSTKDSISNMLAGLKKVESFGERSNNIREELPDLGDEKANRIRSEIMFRFAYPMADVINNGGITNPDAARAIIDGLDAIDDLKQIKDKDFWNFANNYMASFLNPRARLNQDLKNKKKALKDFIDKPITGNSDDLIRIIKLSQANKVASIELYEDTAKDKEVAKKEARYNLMNAALVYIECKDAELEENERRKNRSLEYANIKEENIPYLRDALSYNSLKFWAEANGTPNEIAEKYKAEKGKDKEELKTSYPRWTAKLRFGTKTIKSDPTINKVKTLNAVEDGLKKFKDAHTDIVARKAMDLMGLNAPLYVKRKGKSFPIGRTGAAGYCQYMGAGADATVKEIGVVDYTDKRKSYKTTIHECMHGLLGEIKTTNKKDIIGNKLNNKSHEGLVEIIAQSSLKKFYGKENVKDMSPSYLPFVADTALRLSKLDVYKGMSITEIGRALGEHAINRNEKYINYIAEYLNKNVKEEKAAPTETVDNKIKENPNILDEKANKIVEDRKDFEKSDLAMLVEELKSGRITLSQALINSKYQELAAILIVEILDEEDEDLDIPLF